MIVIKPPQSIKDIEGTSWWPYVFLAGGISNCWDWQQYATYRLEVADKEMVLFNPRRDDFDIYNPALSKEQIGWEYTHIAASETIFFWFPPETLCPITLFELGKAVATGKQLVVGCDPNYQRNFDVQEQLALARPGFKVHDDLDEALAELVSKLK